MKEIMNLLRFRRLSTSQKPNLRSILFFIILGLLAVHISATGQNPTYAERLGFPSGKKVLILHVDDAGMSWDSNQGAIKSIENGVANSMSVMMPCPWVPAIVDYIHNNPEVDAGLHLTLTSEWDQYRWGPLMGKPAVPSLVDKEGALWDSVEDVVEHGRPDEVEAEIRAQIDRALTMGFRPTHLDSHMGTLFADVRFLERYIQVGVEYRIPVMFPGGHTSYLKESYRRKIVEELKKNGKYREGMEVPLPDLVTRIAPFGQKIWEAGLPVLDDLLQTYGWKFPEDVEITDENLQDFYTAKYIEAIDQLKPGLTMVIMHCTNPSEIFDEISSSGVRRRGDMLAMIDTRLKKYIVDEGIILTTWREVMQRRKNKKN